MSGILQDWVLKLGLRHQGVLLGAVRGCDTAPRHDPSKSLSRALRAEFLRAHAGDVTKSRTFIEFCDGPELAARMKAFLDNCDQYPLHFVMHLIHAAEVVGYQGPEDRRAPWCAFYFKACNKLHVTAETIQDLNYRLDADEESFFKAQNTDIAEMERDRHPLYVIESPTLSLPGESCDTSRSEHNRGPWCALPKGHVGPCDWDPSFQRP